MTLDGVAGRASPCGRPTRAASRWSAISTAGTAARHPMRLRHRVGVWELFVPGSNAGARYKFDDQEPRRRAAAAEGRSLCLPRRAAAGTASVVQGCPTQRAGATMAGWRGAPRPSRATAPISIYEVHLGSWRRVPDEGSRYLTYGELADTAGPLCQGSRLHPCRAAADHRASVRRLVGLSADRPVRADQPLRHAGRFRAPSSTRCHARRPRRDPRLGAGPFPDRRARPGALRRHAPLRACRPAPGLASATGTR